MSSISSVTSSYLQSVLSSSLLSRNFTATATQKADSGQLSSFARVANALQQLQQSNPSKYRQVAQQIAANLQSGAQAAQSQGNATAATQLNQLTTDFTTASQTGQLPNLQDLAQAVAGGHHGQHAAAAGASGSSQALTQFLASLQASATQNPALNAATIIENSLTTAGIGV
jgi:HSP90 family molecular chaperone